MSLVYAVPTIAQWELERLPRVMVTINWPRSLAALTIECVRASDHAMALFLVELGLRAGEVAKMQLADIDWQKSVVTIAAGKSRRERLLPLTQRVGKAVASYLRYGRRTTSAGTVFVRHSAPHWLSAKLGTRPLCHGRRGYQRVAGCERWAGTHVLRHTAATHSTATAKLEGGCRHPGASIARYDNDLHEGQHNELVGGRFTMAGGASMSKKPSIERLSRNGTWIIADTSVIN